MMFLIFRDKSEIIKEYYVKKKTISIGSDETSDICIVHKMVSPKHCDIIQLDNGKIRVTDAKSTFGVFVNKKRVNSADINYGDTVGIGPFELDFFPAGKQNEWYALLCISGKLAGKKYMLLKDATKIGRDPSLNDIVISELEDTLASRRHATISKNQKGYALSDKRSKNRTRLNREVLGEEEEALLKPNDEIIIGKQVFRFVPVTETRIRPPSKIYPLWLRIFKSSLGRIAFGLGFAAAVFLIYSAYLNIRTIKTSPKEISFTASDKFIPQFEPSQNQDLSTFITLSGGASVQSILKQSNMANFERLLKKSRAASDPMDVVCFTPSGSISIWNSLSGTRKFDRIAIPSNSPAAVSDLNLDGTPDIVIHSNDTRLYVIDGRSEEALFKSDILGQSVFSAPVVVKSPGSTAPDIVSCTQNGLVNFIYKALYNPRVVSDKIDGSISATPLVRYSGAKPEADIITTNGMFYAYDVKTAKITDQINVKELTEMNALHISATPASGDINGDGSDDLVIITDEEYLIAIDRSGKKLMWKPFSLETSPLQGFSGLHPSCVLTDINGDGKNDIIAVSVKGKVYGVNGATGEVVLQFDSGAQSRMTCSPALADANKDGFNDVFFGTEKGELYALDFHSEKAENMQLYYGKILNKPITGSPVIGDIDADGRLDVIVTANDGTAALLNSNIPTFPGYIYWPAFQGSQERTGYRNGKMNTLFYANIAVIVLAALYMAAFILSFTMRRSKRRVSWIG